ncbi:MULTISPECIES: hypothetical protein [unclassified Spirillospora]|uniref:hypothetical protein n=1 Tax=unclassified Spirillospora TaxID=2642701 RepID=UPI00371BD271
MHDVQGELVLRPDLRRGLAVLATLAVATASIIAAILIGDAPTVFAPIVGVPFTMLISLTIAALLRARIILTPHELVVQGPFGRQRRPRSQFTAAVRASILGPRGVLAGSLFVLGPHRDLLIRVSGDSYTREDFDRLVDAIGVPCNHLKDPIKAKDLDHIYPGLVSRAERHPYRIAIATFALISAATIAIVLLSIRS